jgi:hypothetical protein
MGGGVLQLASIGAEDECLIAHPQITFFKVVFRRHTPFSMESIPQKIKGKVAFGRRVSCTIARNGDLVSNCYLEVEMDTPTVASATWTNWLGHNLINTVDIEIGGQRIDRHTGEWLHIWNELTCPKGKQAAYKKMIGETNAHGPVHLYIPLQFWFCRGVGAALPVVALKYHEIKINIHFNNYSKCLQNNVSGLPIQTTANPGFKAKLYVDYIFLSKDEKKRVVDMTHEYVIDQLQFSGTEILDPDEDQEIQLSLNHPVKELIWVCKREKEHAYVDQKPGSWDSISEMWLPPSEGYVAHPTATYVNITQTRESDGVVVESPVYEKTVSVMHQMSFHEFELCESAQLILNGTPRFQSRPGSYFQLVQPYQHHTSVPQKAIHVYSFSLKPEEIQPTGSCNMSAVDEALLRLKTGAEELRVYALNFNILRITGGMAGMVFES